MSEGEGSGCGEGLGWGNPDKGDITEPRRHRNDTGGAARECTLEKLLKGKSSQSFGKI